MLGRREELKQGAVEAGLVFSTEFVFPNPKDAPSGFAQGANHKEIAFFVGGKFAPPEGAIVHGQVGMFRAGVPETAVHDVTPQQCDAPKMEGVVVGISVF